MDVSWNVNGQGLVILARLQILLKTSYDNFTTILWLHIANLYVALIFHAIREPLLKVKAQFSWPLLVLTCLEQLLDIANIILFLQNNLLVEVNHTELSPSVSVPRLKTHIA